jgi:hypothetical protein
MPRNTHIESLSNLEKGTIEAFEKLKRVDPVRFIKLMTFPKITFLAMGWLVNLELINTLFKELKSRGFIHGDTPLSEFKAIFIGEKPPANKIKWLARTIQLKFLFQCLRDWKIIHDERNNPDVNLQLFSLFNDLDGNDFNLGTLGSYATHSIGKDSRNEIEAIMVEIFGLKKP